MKNTLNLQGGPHRTGYIATNCIKCRKIIHKIPRINIASNNVYFIRDLSPNLTNLLIISCGKYESSSANFASLPRVYEAFGFFL